MLHAINWVSIAPRRHDSRGAMVSALVERYSDRISGVLSCYDRIVVTGTLPTVCYADGMTRFLYA